MADSETGNNEERPENASQQQGNNRRQGNHRPIPHVHQEIFLHYLFLNLSLRYGSYFKPIARRFIEFFSFIIALFMFLILLYIHVTFVRNSGDCLNHVKDIWPQNGILRVQVSHNKSHPPYKLFFVKETATPSIIMKSTPYDIVFKYSSPISNEDVVSFKVWKDLVMNNKHVKQDATGVFTKKHNVTYSFHDINAYQSLHLLKSQCPVIKEQYIKDFKASLSSKLASIVTDATVEIRSDDLTKQTVEELNYSETVESFYHLFEPASVRDHYLIEYSTEFGYLRLSTAARHKLAIPTLVVYLNPDVNACFGNGLKRYMLKTFLGYDDFLMSSIKNLAEYDKSQGYLRNPITGEYFRFVTVWVNHTSGIVAFSAMIIFTLIVTMLLRYSYHQIFVFMVELLRLLDADVRLVFPAAPMLTIILALIGMEEIMTQFFHDSTVAFYVILLIWSADQFDVICLHTVIGRRHWARFFFLYHFAFYIYNYKFNGQFSKLALFTSALFIFHSMLYFLHHFELPAIQRQMTMISERSRLRRAARGDNNPPGDSEHNRPGGPFRRDDDVEEPTDSQASQLPQDQDPPSSPEDNSNNITNTLTLTSINSICSSLLFITFGKINLCKISVLLIAVIVYLFVISRSSIIQTNEQLEIVKLIS